MSQSTTDRARVTLRAFTREDLPVLFEQQLDAEANRVAVANPRDEREYEDHWNRVLSNPEVLARVVVFEGRVVGQISSFISEGRRSVGYWIARAYWRKGIATAAIALLLEEDTARPLHARVARTNIGSLRALERNGFDVVGYQHEPATERFPACEEALLVLRADEESVG